MSSSLNIEVRPRLTHLLRTKDGLRVVFNASPNAHYEILGSRDLVHWERIESLQTSQGATEILLRYPGDSAPFFYRLHYSLNP